MIKRRIGFALSVICFLLSACAHIHKTPDYVVAEGMAPIGKDIWLTRDIAILRAKQAAIEQVGIGIQTERIVDMGFLLDDVIKIQTFGLIKSYEIISEGQDENQYKVKIRVWIVLKENEKPVLENLFAYRSVVVQSKGEGASVIEKTLLGHLTKEKYIVTDSYFTKWRPYYIIKIISEIHFMGRTYGIESYQSACEIKLIRRFEEQLLELQTEPEDNRIYGSNRLLALTNKGPNGFYQKIAQPMVGNFMRQFKAKTRLNEHDVRIVIRGVPSHRVFREKFCGMLRSMRLGVEEVFDEHYKGNIGQVTVRYTEKTDYLAAMIGFRNQYRIEKVTLQSIHIVYVDG